MSLRQFPRASGTPALRAEVRIAACVLVCVATGIPAAQAQDAAEPPSVVVTVTSVAQPAFDTPAAVDVVSGRTLKEGQRGVNLSETLARVPGLNIADRQNYAQDLQISSRGFGARSTFGVRGIRLYADGIPASMPDGSGQVSHFSLSSAARVEVLRGPFSALHGNAAGGVIAIFSEDAPQGMRITPSASYGSFGTWRLGAQVTGTVGTAGAVGSIGYTLDASQFATDGARDHSAARRELENARLKIRLSDATTVTTTFNRVNMPNAQDALGLSRTELDANPDQATQAALVFNTRKSTYQGQGGVLLEHAFSNTNRVHLSAYAGERKIEQYQSITPGAQAPASSAGGVIDLDRRYHGLDARWIHRGTINDGAYTLTAGVSREIQNELRRGYNNFLGTAAAPSAVGVLGALRRDEDNRVANVSRFIQGEWQVWPSIKLSAGLRASRVAFGSTDHFIAGTNGNDSGANTYKATTPAVGVVWSASPRLNFYATAGRGFETPTFNELAYRATGTGLNFGLKAAASRHAEMGMKAQIDGGTVNIALFRADTIDEIVTLTNTGGRAIFQNAGRTRRSGVEIGAMKNIGAGITLSAAYTWINAAYRDGFLTCLATPCAAPNIAVAAGNAMPGIPRESLYLEALWRAPRNSGNSDNPANRLAGTNAVTKFFGNPYAALELRRVSQMYVDDRNSDAASGYTLVNLRAGIEQRGGKWTVTEFFRIDNLANTRYSGSVIVNETNGRFFEPAPGRAWTFGISAAFRFD